MEIVCGRKPKNKNPKSKVPKSTNYHTPPVDCDTLAWHPSSISSSPPHISGSFFILDLYPSLPTSPPLCSTFPMNAVLNLLLVLIHTSTSFELRKYQPIQAETSSTSFRRVATSLEHLRMTHQKLPPSISQQSAGANYGSDTSKCNEGCDYVNGFKCCTDKCVTLEMSCE